MPRIVPRKPDRSWNITPAFIAPEWRWTWRSLVFLLPMLKGGGPPIERVNGIPAATFSGVAWENTVVGSAIEFDGTNADKVDFTDQLGWADLTGSMSLLLVWQRDAHSGFQTIIDKRTDAGGNAAEFLVNMNEATNVFEFCLNDTTAFRCIDAGVLPSAGDDIWHVSVFTRIANGKNVMYLDGDETASGDISQSPTVTAAPIRIGIKDGDVERFNGRVALAAIWKRTLTGNEARLLMADPFAMIRLDLSVLGKVPAAGDTTGVEIDLASPASYLFAVQQGRQPHELVAY